VITVEQIMTSRPDLVTMTPDDTIGAAALAMTRRRTRHIPVIGVDGNLLGIVSDRDVLAVTGSGDCVEQARAPLSDIMSTALHTTDVASGVHAVALSLRRLGISCLPVMRDDELVGIVTDTDFVGVAINLLEVIDDAEPDLP